MLRPWRRTVIALFGPTGVGQDRGRDRARRAAARARRGPGRRLRRRAAGLRGPRDPHRRAPTRPSGRGSSTGWSASCRSTQTFSAGAYARRAHAEIDGLLATGRRADRRRRHRPLPARRARRARPAAARRRPAIRERWTPSSPHAGRRGAARRAGRARPGGRRGDRADRPPAHRPRARAARRRRADAARAGAPSSCGPSDTRHPTLLVGLTMDREALYARIDARVDAMVAAGAAEEVRAAAAAGASATARKALGFEELLAGDVEAMKHATPAATPSASSRGCASCPASHAGRRHRPRRRTTSRRPSALRRARVMMPRDALREVAGAGQRLPHRRARRAAVRAHARARPRGCATRTSAPAPTACSSSRQPDEPGFVARLRIFNPDGSEAELSGNGAREAILYLRRARLDRRSDTFSIQTAAGEIRPTIIGPDDLPRRHGPRAAALDGLPRRPAGRHRRARGRRPDVALPARLDRQPAVRDPRRRPRRARRRSTCAAIGPAIEHAPLFPNRTNVSFWCELAPGAIRARIFERGVGETLSSGTGACGAAVAHVLRGGDSPVTVRLDGGELEVDVDEACTSTSPAGRCRSTAAS